MIYMITCPRVRCGVPCAFPIKDDPVGHALALRHSLRHCAISAYKREIYYGARAGAGGGMSDHERTTTYCVNI
jgi:hypothetical protein